MFKQLTNVVQNAVMGNKIEFDYEIGKQLGSGGPGCLWKMNFATHKTTKQAATVFIFEKRLVEHLPREDRHKVYDNLRKGPAQLAKIKHPLILDLKNPLEENQTTMMFVTEPLFASLANLLGNYHNLHPLPLGLKEFDLHDLDCQIGLLKLCDALKFCHESLKMIHGNIAPEQVFVDTKGDWKLAGFEFVIHLNYKGQADTSAYREEFDSPTSKFLAPNLNYAAPERVLDRKDRPTVNSDLFSLGMLSYSIWNHGKPAFESNFNVLSYEQNLSKIDRVDMSSVPKDFQSFLRRLLSVLPEARPALEDFQGHAFFNNVLLLTLNYLQTLMEKDEQQKAEFMKGLQQILSQFPKRTLHSKILSHLIDELVNPIMIPFVLPNIIIIGQGDMDKHEFNGITQPKILTAPNP